MPPFASQWTRAGAGSLRFGVDCRHRNAVETRAVPQEESSSPVLLTAERAVFLMTTVFRWSQAIPAYVPAVAVCARAAAVTQPSNDAETHMTAWRRSSRIPLSMALVLSACTSWRAETEPLPAPLDERTLSQVRVLTKNGQFIVVYNARLSGDSIIGSQFPPSAGPSLRIAVAVDDVVQLERAKFDLWKTIYTPVAVFGIALLVGVLVAAVTCQPA